MRKLTAEAILGVDGKFRSGIDSCSDVLFESYHDVDSLFMKFDVYLFDSKSYLNYINMNPYFHNDITLYFIQLLDKVRKFVITDSCVHAYGNAMIIRENIISEISRLKNEDGKDILLLAGEDIIRKFTEANLIDEFHLYMHPGTDPYILNTYKLNQQFNIKLKNGFYKVIYKPGGELHD